MSFALQNQLKAMQRQLDTMEARIKALEAEKQEKRPVLTLPKKVGNG